MAAEFPGTYVLTRRQTEIDGIGGAALATLAVGSLWRWAGDPVCIDMPAGPLELGDPLARAELHHHARRAARRILRGIVPADGGRRPSGDAAGPEVGVGAGFSLTDGCRIWKAVLAGSDGPDPLIILTTNEERPLSDAFVRRCLVLRLELPRDRDGLVTHLELRGQAHFKAMDPMVIKKAAGIIAGDRLELLEQEQPAPGMAEFVDLLRAVDTLRPGDAEGQKVLLDQLSEFVLKKHLEL